MRTGPPRKRSIRTTGARRWRCRTGSSRTPSAISATSANVRSGGRCRRTCGPSSPRRCRERRAAGRRLSRGRGERDGLPHGQRPSAVLVLVHGLQQLYGGAWRFPRGDPGLQPRRRQSRRRADGPAGGRLVQGNDRLSRLRRRHVGQRRLDGEHHRADRRAKCQGRRRRSRTRRRRDGKASSLLRLRPDPLLPPQGDGGARAGKPGLATRFRPTPG